MLTKCMLAPESTTQLSFLRFYCGCGRQTPLIGCFFFFFEHIDILVKSPRISAGSSLLSFSLLLRSVLKFHSVGTALMKFDLYFIQRWILVFSDVCLTQRSSCESYSWNWSQDFWGLPGNRRRFQRLDVLRYTTQLSYIFHYCYCTFVTTLLRPFILSFLNLPVLK